MICCRHPKAGGEQRTRIPSHFWNHLFSRQCRRACPVYSPYLGTHGEIRTHTVYGLNVVTLPCWPTWAYNRRARPHLALPLPAFPSAYGSTYRVHEPSTLYSTKTVVPRFLGTSHTVCRLVSRAPDPWGIGMNSHALMILVPPGGIEPPSIGYQPIALPLCYGGVSGTRTW